MSNSLWPHGLQHGRLPCPSPIPRACSNSCPSNQWCHPTILSSVVPFSFSLQSLPASGSFPMSQFFASGGQSTGGKGISGTLYILPISQNHLKKNEVVQSCPILCNPMDSKPTRLLHPWDFPGKSTRVDCHFLLQGIFPTQESYPGFPHCRQTLYHLSHQGSPNTTILV